MRNSELWAGKGIGPYKNGRPQGRSEAEGAPTALCEVPGRNAEDAVPYKPYPLSPIPSLLTPHS